jgi:hypothetical protein
MLNRTEINIAIQEYIEKKYGDSFKTYPIMYDVDTLGLTTISCGFDISQKIKTEKGESEYRRFSINIKDHGEYVKKDKQTKKKK